MIPKIIWQTHNYAYQDLPQHLYKVAKNWEYLNPGWDYRYVDDNARDKMVQGFGDKILYKMYCDSSPVSQSDIWRYITIYTHGGVYADMDSVCIKPLDYMLENYNGEDLVAVETNPKNSCVNPANFASLPNTPFMKRVIGSVRSYPKLPEKHYKGVTQNGGTFSAFSRNALLLGSRSLLFDAALHAEEFKSSFPRFNIDYYGTSMPYEDFLRNILKLSKEETKSLS